MPDDSAARLHAVPLTFRQACQYVAEHHRHNKPPRGMKFCVGDANGSLCGVAIAGRPVARALDDGLTLEINRTCTDGHQNANSFLYGRCRRIAKELGYKRLVTYTRQDESGISLRASGFAPVAELDARGTWAECSVKLKGIRDAAAESGVARIRWEVAL